MHKPEQSMPGPLHVYVMNRGQRVRIGGISFVAGRGYRFLPMYQSGPSRRFWPTPDDALRGRVKNYELVAP